MPGPPRPLETLIGLLIPPACREVVLGDLHERYTSLPQYLADALNAVPLVILSRIWRTTDFQVLLMEAFILYLSFWGAAKFADAAFLVEPLAWIRLAVPAAAALLALMLDDAYAVPGRRWPLKPIRAPIFGVGMAFLSQSTLADLALPRPILLYGAAVSLLLVGAVRMMFPPLADRPQGASGPAFWLQQASEPIVISPGVLRLVKATAMIAAVAVLVALAAHR